MSARTERPVNYPHNSASGIYDANAFRIGNSATVHTPKAYRPHDEHYIGGTVVIARCGAWGLTGEGDNRPASWAGVWADEDQCKRCHPC